MKTILPLFAVLALTGCQSLNKVPHAEFASWTHVGSFGPWQSRLVATDASKQADGTIKLNYSGQVNFLGYGMSDEIKGLILSPQK